MANSSKLSQFRNSIFSDLRERNVKEKRYENVITLCNTLHESVDLLEKENLRLQVQQAKLEQQVSDDVERRSSSGSVSDTAFLNTQKKIYELQTELMDLHRHKSTHAEQVIELRRQVDQKEKEIAEKSVELEEAEEALRISLEKTDRAQEEAADAETSLQLVKDEISALMLTYTSVEKAKDDLEAEYKDLTERWLVYRAKAADELNAENEMCQRLKQLKVKQEMEEAVREPASSSSNLGASKY